MNKKILFLVLLAVVSLPSLASALTLGGMATSAMNAILDAAVAIVVILWVVTGILFLLAQGAPEKLKSARTALFSSIVGTIIILLAEFAMSFIAGIFGIGS